MDMHKDGKGCKGSKGSKDGNDGKALQPPAASPGDRYLCSVYTLDPLCRPEMHRVVCLLLAKAPISDDELRAFIAQHIDTATVPDCNHFSECYTMNFAQLHSTSTMPALLTQLLDYCSRTSATRFEEPLTDGAADNVGFLSLKPCDWQHTADVASALRERLLADAKVDNSGNDFFC
jgi:hypothetical protein